MSTGLPRPCLARSAHRGRIKFLRGYVSKSSAAVNPLTITQLACERYIARTSMRSAFRGPVHQLAVRMRINYGPSNQPCTMRQQLRVRRGGLHFSAFMSVLKKHASFNHFIWLHSSLRLINPRARMRSEGLL